MHQALPTIHLWQSSFPIHLQYTFGSHLYHILLGVVYVTVSSLVKISTIVSVCPCVSTMDSVNNGAVMMEEEAHRAVVGSFRGNCD